jgi:hypothetical protein
LKKLFVLISLFLATPVYADSLAGGNPDNIKSCTSAADITDTVAITIDATCVAKANVRRYISKWSCGNTSATATRMDLLDNATVIWSQIAGAGTGFAEAFPEWLKQPTRNSALRVQAATTATATRCSVSFVESAQ